MDKKAKPKLYNHETASVMIPNPLAEQAKREPVAWHEPGAYSNVTVYKNWANENGWIPLYAAPVRTKNLTDDEIAAVTGYRKSGATWPVVKEVARAVIAADREKNK